MASLNGTIKWDERAAAIALMRSAIEAMAKPLAAQPVPQESDVAYAMRLGRVAANIAFSALNHYDDLAELSRQTAEPDHGALPPGAVEP